MNRKPPEWEKELTEAPVGMGGLTAKSMKRIKERIQLTHRKRRKLQPYAAAALAVALLGGGWLLREPLARLLDGKTAGVAGPVVAEAPGDPVQLTVHFRQPGNFNSDIGLLYTIRHPEVRFLVPETDPETRDAQGYLKWIDETRPDIVQVPLALVDDLAAAGAVVPLDDWIARDGYQLDELYEPVVRTVREAGGGKLYGLAPNFETKALYYNKSLFDEFGIPLPSGNLGWTETLELAARFVGGKDAEGNPIYGLAVQERDNPFSLIADIGVSRGLRLGDGSSGDASNGAPWPTLDSAAWLEVWEETIPGFRDGWIASGNAKLSGSFTKATMYAADPFLDGHAAMAIRDGAYAYGMEDAQKELGTAWEWGVLQLPREHSAYFTVNVVYAVNASSPFADAAWSFLQFLAGPERRKHDLQLGRTSANFTRLPAAGGEGPADEAVYGQSPDSAKVYDEAEKTLSTGYGKWRSGVSAAGNKAANDVVAGKMSAAEALRELQTVAESLTAGGLAVSKEGGE